MTSPLSVSCTAIFNGLMISGQPGRHRIGTIGVTKLVKYYTAFAIALALGSVCLSAMSISLLMALLFVHFIAIF